MKFKNIIASAAILAAFSVGLKAQTVTANIGDLLVGFKTASNASNLEVDIGSFSNYTAMDGATTTISQLSLLDLSALRSSWTSSTNVLWGVAGGDPSSTAPHTSFLTKAAVTPGTSALPSVN